MTATRHAAIACYQCGYRFDAATGLRGGGSPDEGSVSICIACGALGMYVRALGALTVRAVTAAERDELIADPLIRQALAVRASRIGDDLRPGGRS